MKIAEVLQGVRRLSVDTSPYIYYVENHPIYADKMDAVFRIIESRAIEIYTAVITLTETLVKPIQKNDQGLIDVYRELLTETDNVHLIPITSTLAENAAHLRARYNLRTPDALQVTAAISSGCDTFLTNDLDIKRVTELRILVLNELEVDAPKEVK